MKKKGVSILIGYVLLIVFALIMGTIVYNVIKTYVPKDVPECPSGVSIFIRDINLTGSKLTVEIMNNGLFDIAGYYIRATDKPEKELATKDLSKFLNPSGEKVVKNAVLFTGEENSMKPNEKRTQEYTIDEQIYLIEIVPIRFQEEDNKNQLINCGNSNARETVK